VSGEVYHDGLGKLLKIRKKLEFYPNDVWLYLLAAQWTRISEEEAFVGRTGHVGDELGSRIIAARMVREIMKLSFLMEKQYAPYTKWLGTAFSRLKIGRKLTPVLQEVLAAKTWKAREKKLARAYAIVARQHNALKLTKPLPTNVSKYYDRPYFVIHGDAFATSIRESIKDPKLKRMTTNAGSIDQFVDNHDLLQHLSVLRRLRVVYEEGRRVWRRR
jgi:UDP-2,3-diacylglucosamine pyrophosphatase LpxH